jgi:uncharacterized protein (TIGR00369 family)
MEEISKTKHFPPPGFEPYPAVSPFMALLGPIYAFKEDGHGITIGLVALERHLNHQGIVHGGVAATLADNAMGYQASQSLGGPVATVNLAVDYLAAIRAGDWLEIRSRIDRQGKRMLFLACMGTVGDRPVFRAHAVFSAVRR